MSEFTIYQDQRMCIGCRACEVHCKAEHDLPAGPQFCKIIEVGPQLVQGIPRINFMFMPCFHCEEAFCISACPTGAMQKRDKDGIVWVEAEACIGCKTCITACPWGIPQWDNESGKVIKCDYCKDRLDEGLEPACVTGCVTGSLQWLRPGEIADLKRTKSAREMAEPFNY